MLRTVAIKKFLELNTHDDLAKLYNINMECQVNVAQDNGERIQDEYKGRIWVGWQNPVTGDVWKPFRIPYNAKNNPHYEDKDINFSLEHHAEGIGMTGWDWRNRLSRWVGFDFDAITGHSDQHSKKLTNSELCSIENVVADIPWVTVRLSTSGKGRHIYVFTNVETQNHDEHAALARAILGKLAGITGFDFQTKVDICGGNLWVWHRKMRNTDGLKLLKQGELLTDIPDHWLQHLDVIRNKRTRILPDFITNQDLDTIQSFEDISNQKSIFPLDDQHKFLMNWLMENGLYCQWDNDHKIMITHTSHLKRAHEELGLKGLYNTISEGTEGSGDYNCYCNNLSRGAWSVRRYTKGVAETKEWHQDSNGWTRIYFNREPDFDTACRTFDGVLLEKGGYAFPHIETAIDAAKALGVYLDTPQHLIMRECILKRTKDGNLYLTFEHQSKDEGLSNFHLDKKHWHRVYPANLQSKNQENDVQVYNDVVRNLVNEDGVFIGWFIKSEKGWTKQPDANITKALLALPGMDYDQVVHLMGNGVFRHWTLVNKPFQPEYLPDRNWNRYGAKMMFLPSNSENLSFPTWSRILTHIGEGLNDAIKNNQWCKSNGITTGADYLKVWVAAMFKYPLKQAPYLFIYSDEQNTGKGIFYEAIEKLINPEAAKEANTALLSKGDFNGELANAVFCYVNEVNLSRGNDRGTDAYNKIKNWVTGLYITIHPKGKDTYKIPNATHWVQVANDISYCPVFPGDTRITMIRVKPLEEIIPKETMMNMLIKEAPDFMAELLRLEIPESTDRLVIPVIDTEEKTVTQITHTSPIQLFFKEKCFYSPGEMISLREITNYFHKWLLENDNTDIDSWSTRTVGNEIPSPYMKGKSRKDNQTNIINISLTKPTDEQLQNRRLIIKQDGKIYRDGD